MLHKKRSSNNLLTHDHNHVHLGYRTVLGSTLYLKCYLQYLFLKCLVIPLSYQTAHLVIKVPNLLRNMETFVNVIVILNHLSTQSHLDIAKLLINKDSTLQVSINIASLLYYITTESNRTYLHQYSRDFCLQGSMQVSKQYNIGVGVRIRNQSF